MTICVLCGRLGLRGFVLLSGTMDGTRDSWCCSNRGACERRQHAYFAKEDAREKSNTVTPVITGATSVATYQWQRSLANGRGEIPSLTYAASANDHLREANQ